MVGARRKRLGKSARRQVDLFLLEVQHAQAVQRARRRAVFEVELIERKRGLVAIRVSGSDAETAFRMGLVNAVVPHAELMSKTREVAAKIASKGPLAIAQCKRVLLRGLDVPLPVANELEAQAFAALFGSHDQREGMKAFLEKRKASWCSPKS